MQAAWLRARAEIRTAWRSLAAVALLLGILGGATMAVAAGARRTESAYPRFLEAQNALDVVADVRNEQGRPVGLERVAALEAVDEAATALLVPVLLRSPSGDVVGFPEAFPLLSPDGRFGHTLNAVKLLEGRRPDLDDPHELLVGFTVAERFNLKVGDVLQGRPVFGDGEAPPLEMTIAGIGAMPGEFQAVAGGSIPAIHFTPAFHERYRLGEDEAYALRLRSGARGVAAFEQQAAKAGMRAFVFFRQDTQTAAVRRSSRFSSVSLWALALAAGIAGSLLLGQALARQAMLASGDQPVLRALGMSRAQTVAVSLLRVAPVVLVAVPVALALAVASSSLFPLGIARTADPVSGVMIDAAVLSVGSLALILVAVGASVVAAARAARAARPGGRVAFGAAGKPSRLAEAAARSGASPAAVAGIRLALEPGSGRTAVPVRSALASAVLAIAVIVGAQTFAASMDKLARSPALAGWSFDMLIGGTDDVRTQVRSFLERKGVLAHAAEGGIPGATIGRSFSLDVILVIPAGPLSPAVDRGRPPVAADEIALGRDVMEKLGLEVGDTTTLSLSTDPRSDTRSPDVPVRVVGRLVMPSLGFNLGSTGEGAAISSEAWHRLDPETSEEDRQTFVALRPGTDVEPLTDEIRRTFEEVWIGARRDAETVRDLGSVSGMPAALAALLGATAAGTLAHALVTSVRRRRREIAILRTLGFVRRQVRAVVVWQATTLVVVAALVAVPLGVVVGRWGWLTFAELLGVVPVAVVPLVLLAVGALVTLVAANLVALLPARLAARVAPGAVLRSE